MGRAPCCDKANVKKGPWSPEEDAKLKSYIEQHGTGGNWIALPQKIGLKRCGKSCRLRWLNYLRPNLKHGGFSVEEDNIICSLYVSIGSRWSVIAAQLPGRTDNDIKNYWNTRLKKKLLGNNNKHRNKEQHQYQQQEARSNNNNTSVVIVKQESNNNNNNNINRGINSCVVDDYYCGDSLLSLLVPQNSTTHQQNPYNWQQIMMPNMLEEPISQSFPHTTNNNNQQSLFGNCCFNNNNDDQEDSIKKLLTELGGRFSSSSSDDDDYGNYHPTLDNGFNPPHQFQEQVHHVESSVHCINNGNNNELQFAQGDDFDLVHHGQGSSNATIEEMVSTNFLPQRLHGLEFFYGNEDMVSDKIILGSSRPNNNNWGETIISSTTPIFHQGVREDTAQECALEVFNSYPGEQ